MRQCHKELPRQVRPRTRKNQSNGTVSKLSLRYSSTVHLMYVPTAVLGLFRYANIPFEDIRYILGEIMYGGHITDGFDRRVNNTYLAGLILPEVLQSYQLGPSFRTPDPAKTDFALYEKFVEERTPPENPQV